MYNTRFLYHDGRDFIKFCFKILLYISHLFYFTAVGSVRADAEECTEERAEACLDNLLSAILNDATEEEACRYTIFSSRISHLMYI